MGFYGEETDNDWNGYFSLDEESIDGDALSPMEMDILKVLNTYLTITKYLLHKPEGKKKELKEDIKKVQKMKEALLNRDGSIKKYLDEDGQYYDLL